MFSEILKIKPVLEPASAAKMEKSLNQRFSRVATRFGSGLKKVVAGSVIGISLGLLSKILNPLEEIEDKIKKLLGEGEDLEERASRFSTTPGKLLALENAFRVEGVNPDQFNSLITSFATALEESRREIQYNGLPQSQRTAAVAEFARDPEKDTAVLFARFMESLRDQARGEGFDFFFEENKKTRLTGPQASEMFQREVFGAEQYGAVARVIEKGLHSLLQQSGTPTTVNGAVENLARVGRVNRILEIQREMDNMVSASSSINTRTVRIMDEMEKNNLNRENKQLRQFEQLAEGAKAVQEIANLLKDATSQITILIGKGIALMSDLIKKFDSMPFFRTSRGSK